MKKITIELNQKDIKTINGVKKDFLRYIEQETLHLNSLKKENTIVKGTNYYSIVDPIKLSYEQERVDGLWDLYEKLY